MKVSLIPWHVFLEACDEENADVLESWVKRWLFADDGVRVSAEPALQQVE